MWQTYAIEVIRNGREMTWTIDATSKQDAINEALRLGASEVIIARLFG